MIVDGRSVPDSETLEADVCIVGAGPAGSTLARSLIGSGLRVCVLESGGEVPDAQTSELSAGASTAHPYFVLRDARSRAVGGSSHLWEEYLRVRPLDPLDLERRAGLPWSGWPVTAEELSGYYEAAHHALHVGDDGYGPASWEDGLSRPLPLSGALAGTTVFRYTNTYDLTARGMGLEQSGDVMLVTRATATELIDADGSILETRVRCLGGTSFSVRARVYVLAAGGIENPRLLLASRSSLPRGIGNGHDLVGRFFMEHLHVRSAIFVPSPDAGDLGFYQQHENQGSSLRGALVPGFDVLRREGLLNSSFLLLPSDSIHASDAYRSLSVLARRLTGRKAGADAGSTAAHVGNLVGHPAQATRAAVGSRAGRRGTPVFQLAATAEQAPNPQSRVTLDAQTDDLGMPRPILAWQLGELERRSIRRAEELIDEELRGAGLGHLERMFGEERPKRVFRGHWHHMGTTRMSDHEERGVVNRDGRVHGVDNLYIAGSSVFPTGGYVNPTLTVVALSLRLADRLIALLGSGMGPYW